MTQHSSPAGTPVCPNTHVENHYGSTALQEQQKVISVPLNTLKLKTLLNLIYKHCACFEIQTPFTTKISRHFKLRSLDNSL